MPRLYSPDAANAAKSPMARPLIGRADHTLLLAAGAGAGAAFVYLIPSITAGLPALRPLLGVRDRLAPPVGVALTFDDGPHAEGTPAVLELLRQAGVTATFFLVGEQVARQPALAAEIAAAGHGIGVHCTRHRSLLRLTPRQVRDDLERAGATIAEATGVLPRLYRPPYGVLNTSALRYAKQQGWETVLWRRDGHDWQARATPASITARILRGVEPGDILLLHDADDYSAPGSWRRTSGALPLLFERLALRQLEIRPLEPLGPPYARQ